MSRAFIAGNWKMNLDRKGAVALARGLRERLARLDDRDVAVFPPFVYIEAVARELAGSPIGVGGQNVCEHEQGAYTGEVSARMLRDAGARFAIIGHSERRHVYGEDDELVRRKVNTALASDLQVIVCIGETLEEREQGVTEKVVSRQLSRAFEEVGAADLPRVTVAYEPVWAIGTGRTATPEQVGAVHTYLRGVLAGLYDAELSRSVRIQYGGSVNPKNIASLMAALDVDGALVGGASLELDSFLAIVEYK